MKTTITIILVVSLVFFYAVSSTTIWQYPLEIAVVTAPIATVAVSATLAVETVKMQMAG
ncbi:MAG: hypothetical protein WCI79_02840 [Candidatus Saccharibacteria bacterium]